MLDEGFEREWGLNTKKVDDYKPSSWDEKDDYDDEYEDEPVTATAQKGQPQSAQDIGLKDLWGAFTNPEKMDELIKLWEKNTIMVADPRDYHFNLMDE